MAIINKIQMGSDGRLFNEPIEVAGPQMKSGLSGQFGRGFDESAVQEAMTHFPQPQNNNFKI